MFSFPLILTMHFPERDLYFLCCFEWWQWNMQLFLWLSWLWVFWCETSVLYCHCLCSMNFLGSVTQLLLTKMCMKIYSKRSQRNFSPCFQKVENFCGSANVWFKGFTCKIVQHHALMYKMKVLCCTSWLRSANHFVFRSNFKIIQSHQERSLFA